MTTDGYSSPDICPDCGSENLMEDTERDEIVCGDCGLAMNEAGEQVDWQNKKEEKNEKEEKYGFSGEYEEISVLMRVEADLDALGDISLGIEAKRDPGSRQVTVGWDHIGATSLEVVLKEIINNVYVQDVEGGDTIKDMPRPIAESTTEAIRAEIRKRDGEGSDCATMLCDVILSWDVADGYPPQKDDVDLGDIHSVYGGAVRDADFSIESLGCYREIGVRKMVPSALAYAVEQSNDIDYYDLHSPM